ncbi:hypothetical protein AB0N89_25280 [Amycolatopsis sp. NPDC089917]|uniref:hypothetical protein n=1 Tax=Amycolatopsis sp. NPDC089917 TaxID=3155187 RepID=UPI00341F576F
MGDRWWLGVVGAVVVVGGVLLQSSSDRKWRSFIGEAVTIAGWLLIVMFVIKPLVPGNVLGIVILVLIVLCVLAVPVYARYKARRQGQGARSPKSHRQ